MAFTSGQSGIGGGSRRGPWPAISGVTAVAVIGVCAWLGVRSLIALLPRPSSPDLEIDPRPVIISLQQVGELHTTKMTMKDVMHQASDKGAEGWLNGVPGADFIARWATRNEALVTAEGTVEAGIDLSRVSDSDVTPISRGDGTRALRVHLPEATIYRPNLTVRVEGSHAGLMWRDENIVPRAEAEFEHRFRDAAEKDGLRQKAQQSAVERLQRMEHLLGHNNVEFTY